MGCRVTSGGSVNDGGGVAAALLPGKKQNTHTQDDEPQNAIRLNGSAFMGRNICSDAKHFFVDIIHSQAGS